jgi:hypothetical protein
MADKSHISERNDPRKGMIPETTPSEIISGRKKLLEITDALIEETYHRISGDRFRLREGDRERLAYLRTLISLITLYNLLLKGGDAPSLEDIDFTYIEEKNLKKRHIDEMLDM